MINTIIGDGNTIASLKGKSATFMLMMSTTATADIEGITQAGIPGMIYLTPTLDAEFICTGGVHSLGDVAKTPKGVPTPALMTRAIEQLRPFGRIGLLDLGVRVTPKVDNTIHAFGIEPSGNIAECAKIDARSVFEAGYGFGKGYAPQDDYVILAESVPSGTSTATASALGLGLDVRGYFSSSFADVPDSIRNRTIDAALEKVEGMSDPFEILGCVGDNMLIFGAGMVLGSQGRYPIVLAGGTQMAGLLLIANALQSFVPASLAQANVTLATTRWVAEDTHSDIRALLEKLDTPIEANYADFDFSLSDHPALKLYDQGEAKEGVGAGGALAYGMLNGLSRADITGQVEKYLG